MLGVVFDVSAIDGVSDVVLIATLVLFGTFITGLMAALSPLLLSRLNARQQAMAIATANARQDRIDLTRQQAMEAVERKRQMGLDAVALQAAEAARLVAEQTVTQAKVNEEQGNLLRATHALVNSGYTEAKESELDARQADLLSLKQLMAMKVADGSYPPPGLDLLAYVAIQERKVEELVQTVATRKAATAAAIVANDAIAKSGGTTE